MKSGTSCLITGATITVGGGGAPGVVALLSAQLTASPRTLT
jgi:hypothetical protein